MTDFLTPSIELAPEHSPARRPIAATVDAGLAGLLSNVLANQRRMEAPSETDLLDEDSLFDAAEEGNLFDTAEEDSLFAEDQEDLLVDEAEESLLDEEDSLFGDEDALLAEDSLLTEDSLLAEDSLLTEEALLTDEDSLFGDDDSLLTDEELLLTDEDSLLGDEDALPSEEESLFGDEDSLFGGAEVEIDGDQLATTDLFPTIVDEEPVPVFESSASGYFPASATGPTTVTHVIVHHVADSAPAPKLGRFGPSVTPTVIQTAAEAAVTVQQLEQPIPKLRDAFDSFDDEAVPAFGQVVEDSSVIAPPASFTPQVAAELAESNKINFDNNPVFLPGVTPTPSAVAAEKVAPPPAPRVARILSPLQINLLIEGLAQVRARPGEEGLPPGMLLMDVRGPLGRFQTDSLYTIRSQIDGAVRGGDMALVVPDIGIVLFCGGLFFPGDLEVMGSRLRRRALDANPSAIPSDAIRVTVAGALAYPGDDAIEFVKRGVETFDVAVETAREDIVIDYIDPRRPRV